jgi:hypothetical protein
LAANNVTEVTDFSLLCELEGFRISSGSFATVAAMRRASLGEQLGGRM